MKKPLLCWSKRLKKMEKDHFVTLDHKDCGELAEIIDTILGSIYAAEVIARIREYRYCRRYHMEAKK